MQGSQFIRVRVLAVTTKSGKAKRTGKDYTMREAKCRALVWNGKNLTDDVVGVVLPDGLVVDNDRDYNVELVPAVGQFQSLKFVAVDFVAVAPAPAVAMPGGVKPAAQSMRVAA